MEAGRTTLLGGTHLETFRDVNETARSRKYLEERKSFRVVSISRGQQYILVTFTLNTEYRINCFSSYFAHTVALSLMARYTLKSLTVSFDFMTASTTIIALLCNNNFQSSYRRITYGMVTRTKMSTRSLRVLKKKTKRSK